MPRVRVLVEQQRPNTSHGARPDLVTQLRNSVAQMLDKHSDNMKEVAYKEIYELLHDSTKALFHDYLWVRVTIAIPSISTAGETPRAYIRSLTVQLRVLVECFNRAKELMTKPTLTRLQVLIPRDSFMKQCTIDTLDNYSEWCITGLTSI